MMYRLHHCRERDALTYSVRFRSLTTTLHTTTTTPATIITNVARVSSHYDCYFTIPASLLSRPFYIITEPTPPTHRHEHHQLSWDQPEALHTRPESAK
ncbi:hypothetical protein C5167_042702 [Papaver somniferum]|uniref:Uncharacterized protein n=1 Tax=Papaver somniferum TaxID=3469 RepID=A0A4Y7L3K2_PAPSO|nr:hypothetical protein C5167_042702 [Papaver somniferum]